MKSRVHPFYRILKSHSLWPVMCAAYCLASLFILRAETASVDYSAAIRQLEQATEAEMARWNISGIALALVDDQQTVYAAGFGEAKKDSVFRAGSISKLFNAVAVLQQVEAGQLDLDAPVENYGHDLLPVNPFTAAGSVTLRQLLCHRSGMIRESPMGGYFDDAEPGLARTIASVTQCVLVNPPNTKTRYSNVGPSIAGQVVERGAKTRFERYQQERIFGPLGMSSSAWLVKDLPPGRLVPAYMRIADGQGGFNRKPAPVFDLGTLPAGNLFTTAEDLARFVSMLAAGGEANGGRILKAETLAQMFTPQLTRESVGFGLGFMVGKFRQHKIVSHSGAVYGHSTALLFLPDSKIGAIVLGNEDIVNGRISRLANLALSLMLKSKDNEEPPVPPTPVTLATDELERFTGDYESQSFWAKLEVKAGQLIGDMSGQPITFTPVGALSFLADSRLDNESKVTFERNVAGAITGFTLGPQKFARVPATVPTIPATWKTYLGSYGPSFIPLVVSVRHGHLYAMTENMVDYRLTPVNRYVFAFPPGLYADEYLVFLTDAQGKPHHASLANMVLTRW